MHMVRPHDEADELRLHLIQLMIENAEQDLFRRIKVKLPTSSMAREGDDMNVLLVVGNRPFRLAMRIRVAVFAWKRGRATTGGCCSGSGISPEACLLCFAHRLASNLCHPSFLKSTGVTREFMDHFFRCLLCFAHRLASNLCHPFSLQNQPVSPVAIIPRFA